MTIAIGQKVPSATLYRMGKDGPQKVTTDELFSGKKVIVFGLPGAFTPTCSAAHLPGFVAHSDKIFEKGVDAIVCLSVNDAYVMDAWGKRNNVEDRIIMAADGNADLARALGLDLDLTARGMGIRCQRFAMIVDDGVVKLLNVEQPGKFEVSDAETILKAL